MEQRNTIGTALAVLAVVLFTVPAFFPVQPQLVHDTGRSTTASPADLEEEGYEVVAYGNLSERGQELYVAALEDGGEYRVSVGDGASDFEYLNQTERRQAFRGEGSPPGIVIERPEDDEDLPPADEHSYHIPEDENVSEEERQRAESAERYDMMRTSVEEPPLGATPQLVRLASVLLAVLSLGVGGYLLSSK